MTEIALGGREDIDSAVAAANKAFSEWCAVSPRDRGRLLRRFASLIEENGERLALLETRNVGKPIRDALAEVQMAADVFDYYAGAVDKHVGMTIPVAGGVDVTFHEPLGVVGVIVPWNFPIAITAWNVAPALAAGNAVVVKPSELTPLTALELQELALAAGLPEGLVSVVVGDGATAGQRLVDSPSVAKISFTGSTPVGRQVMRSAAGTLKRVTLELGGKAANIVFSDADLDQAAHDAVTAVFGNSGQDCCSRARVLVQRSVYDSFVDRFLLAAAEVRVGDPESPNTDMGPLISETHRQKVSGFITEDVEVLYRAALPAGPGFWFPPTVVGVDDPRCRLAQEEIFGPVAALMSFEDEADAIQIANDTPYGLSGSVWTKDGAVALRMARALQVGTLSVNSNSSVRVSTPFGGVKQSGIGRELGMAAMDAYSELKNVFIRISA